MFHATQYLLFKLGRKKVLPFIYWLFIFSSWPVVSEFQKVLFLVHSAVQVNGAARCNRPKGPQQIKREALPHPPRTTLCVSVRYRGELGTAAWSITVQNSQIVEFSYLTPQRQTTRVWDRDRERVVMIMMVNAIGVLGRDTKMDRRECGVQGKSRKVSERRRERQRWQKQVRQCTSMAMEPNTWWRSP